MSIGGIGAAGGANAELAILLSKLRATGEAENVASSGAALPALSGQPETVSGTAAALSGTGKAALGAESLAYLTMMQADDGNSVAAANTDTFTSSVNNNSLWDLVTRWSLGSNSFSTVSKNITIATVIAENMPSSLPSSGAAETSALNAGSVSAVDMSSQTSDMTTAVASTQAATGTTATNTTAATANAGTVNPTTVASEQAAAMASVLGALLTGYNPMATMGAQVDISG